MALAFTRKVVYTMQVAISIALKGDRMAVPFSSDQEENLAGFSPDATFLQRFLSGLQFMPFGLSAALPRGAQLTTEAAAPFFQRLFRSTPFGQRAGNWWTSNFGRTLGRVGAGRAAGATGLIDETIVPMSTWRNMRQAAILENARRAGGASVGADITEGFAGPIQNMISREIPSSEWFAGLLGALPSAMPQSTTPTPSRPTTIGARSFSPMGVGITPTAPADKRKKSVKRRRPTTGRRR